MEAALKLGRQYYVEAGQPARSLLIARRQSYHGNTLGALAIGGNAWRRRPFEPLLMDVPRVAPCFEYRERLEGQTSSDYTRAAGRTGTVHPRPRPANLIGFVAETMVGAHGRRRAHLRLLPGVRKLCDQYGILLILDEVMCGMGRCGTLYAFEQEGVLPDLVVLGKGLGAGYQPIGAVLAGPHRPAPARRQRRLPAWPYLHGPPGGRGGRAAVQKVIQRDNLLGAVATRGAPAVCARRLATILMWAISVAAVC
jgi:adenosylmethionine-8-amino-7-oxononanoate aminotransferase